MRDRINDYLVAIEKVEQRIGPWLFYLALSLTFVSTIFFCNKNVPDLVFSLSRCVRRIVPWLCYARLALFLPKHYRYVLASLTIIVFFALSWHFSGQKTLFNASLLILASHGSDVRCSLKIFGTAIAAILLVAFISYFGGYTGDLQTHSFGMVGHSFGTVNPNTLGCFLLMLTEIVLILWDVKLSKQVWVVCWVMCIGTWILTLCSTSAMIFIIFPILYFFVRRVKLPSFYYAFFPWILLIASVVLMFYYGPSLGETTFESRFSMPAIAYDEYGLSWMGQYCGQMGAGHARELGMEPFYIDNMYLRLFLYFGIIPGSLVMLFESHLLSRIAQRKEPLVLVVALCSCLIGLMEAYPLFVFNNVALLYYLAKDNTGEVTTFI